MKEISNPKYTTINSLKDKLNEIIMKINVTSYDTH